jgi:hypothetical protein
MRVIASEGHRQCGSQSQSHITIDIIVTKCQAPYCLKVAMSQVKSSYITTDGKSASLSWCQAPLSDTQPIFLPFLNYF